MSDIMQWVLIGILCILVYFGYIHGFIRNLRSMKVRIGMTRKEVRRLIGSPNKEIKHGSNIEAIYNFCFANRLVPDTKIVFRIIFDKNNKVVKILEHGEIHRTK